MYNNNNNIKRYTRRVGNDLWKIVIFIIQFNDKKNYYIEEKICSRSVIGEIVFFFILYRNGKTFQCNCNAIDIVYYLVLLYVLYVKKYKCIIIL